MVSEMIWRPDTCGCVLKETHDPEDPSYGVRFAGVVTKCPAHEAIPHTNLYGVVYANPDGENKRKNLVHKFLVEDPRLAHLARKDAKGSLLLKDEVEYIWEFDERRVLKVQIKGAPLTEDHKKHIHEFANATFGQGKVIVL
jgi:hypothetical protein